MEYKTETVYVRNSISIGCRRLISFWLTVVKKIQIIENWLTGQYIKNIFQKMSFRWFKMIIAISCIHRLKKTNTHRVISEGIISRHTNRESECLADEPLVNGKFISSRGIFYYFSV